MRQKRATSDGRDTRRQKRANKEGRDSPSVGQRLQNASDLSLPTSPQPAQTYTSKESRKSRKEKSASGKGRMNGYQNETQQKSRSRPSSAHFRNMEDSLLPEHSNTSTLSHANQPLSYSHDFLTGMNGVAYPQSIMRSQPNIHRNASPEISSYPNGSSICYEGKLKLCIDYNFAGQNFSVGIIL